MLVGRTGVVVLDAASSVAAAVQALGANPAARVIAVGGHAAAAAMPQMIAAGAADVMTAPVTADVPARTVKRRLRRR